MSKFNLLDEPWIAVIDHQGATRELSLLDFFAQAHLYRDFAGDTKTQDFAVMRVLLAVLHTVFSRFDATGKPYPYLRLDERYKPSQPIKSDNQDDYEECLYHTWLDLYKLGKFPAIVSQYLEKWRERFYLFDEQYPFFQVKQSDIATSKLNKKSATPIKGRNINRLLSESSTKVALFSPKSGDYKGKLKEGEIVRWLITFHGFTGLADKSIFGQKKYKASKGWLFDLGGTFLKGNNLFTTLMANFYLPNKANNNLLHIQNPCWENDSSSIIDHYLQLNTINNLASLYTAWSRAIYINPHIDLSAEFVCHIVKLPEITHQNQFLEPMTVWKFNQKGDNANTYTPKKHQLSKAMWRSFGLLVGCETAFSQLQRMVGIIEWLIDIQDLATKYCPEFTKKELVLCAVGMQDDGNATSWVPTDEVIDTLDINHYVLTDLKKDGWIMRINETVLLTEKIVDFVFKNFLSKINKLRGEMTGAFVEKNIAEMYFLIDAPFREWLAKIKPGDEKEATLQVWHRQLKSLVGQQAEKILFSATPRDYHGKRVLEDPKNTNSKFDSINNIFIIYNHFIASLNHTLNLQEGNNATTI